MHDSGVGDPSTSSCLVSLPRLKQSLYGIAGLVCEWTTADLVGPSEIIRGFNTFGNNTNFCKDYQRSKFASVLRKNKVVSVWNRRARVRVDGLGAGWAFGDDPGVCGGESGGALPTPLASRLAHAGPLSRPPSLLTRSGFESIYSTPARVARNDNGVERLYGVVI